MLRDITRIYFSAFHYRSSPRISAFRERRSAESGGIQFHFMTMNNTIHMSPGFIFLVKFFNKLFFVCANCLSTKRSLNLNFADQF